jgi:hypothetical protein
MIKDVETLAKEKDERFIYFCINECGSFRWSMEHGMRRGRIATSAEIMKDIETAAQDQQVLAGALTRFGLVQPLTDDKHPTEEYWKWFRWWDAWSKGLSDEEFRAMDAALARGMTPEEDARFRPQGSWREVEAQAV